LWGNFQFKKKKKKTREGGGGGREVLETV